MPAARIVKAFDELEDGDARLGVRPEPPPVEQLTFEGGEEAFRHGIVVSVADRAHRRADAHLAAALAEGQRGVLGEPWSEWWITPCGLRTASAMSSAASTSSACSVVDIDQPTMRRLNTSSTMARYRNPAQVGM
jgi:hypothetical protein